MQMEEVWYPGYRLSSFFGICSTNVRREKEQGTEETEMVRGGGGEKTAVGSATMTARVF